MKPLSCLQARSVIMNVEEHVISSVNQHCHRTLEHLLLNFTNLHPALKHGHNTSQMSELMISLSNHQPERG